VLGLADPNSFKIEHLKEFIHFLFQTSAKNKFKEMGDDNTLRKTVSKLIRVGLSDGDKLYKRLVELTKRMGGNKNTAKVDVDPRYLNTIKKNTLEVLPFLEKMYSSLVKKEKDLTENEKNKKKKIEEALMMGADMMGLTRSMENGQMGADMIGKMRSMGADMIKKMRRPS
jgi:hypothetical protein